jgi:pimeloyl-ACP methyl ester carboxylesterase/putative sterol carrier protein
MSAVPASAASALESAVLSADAFDLDAIVSIDLGEDDRWSIRVLDGQVAVAPGLDPQADTTVFTDRDTFAAVSDSRESGIKAFLEGRLRVRGNLALSLRLDGLLQRQRPRRFPRARTVVAGGLRTFYLEAGDGPPVLLLHGLGATNASFLPTLWDLAQDHRVLAPDLPGFGDTDKPTRRYDSAFFARWARAFLDRTGVDRADVIGNSMGGRVAIELGMTMPERVRNLVLLAPSPAFIRRRQFVRIVRLLRPEMALLPLPLRHRSVVWGIKKLFARPERLPDPWYLAAADEFLRIFSRARGRIAFFSAARQIYLEEPYGDVGFWDRLPSLDVPSLFVWGERDRLVPSKFARHVERALPNATSVVMEDCGHVPQFELPDDTHELVRRFIG